MNDKSNLKENVEFICNAHTTAILATSYQRQVNLYFAFDRP